MMMATEEHTEWDRSHDWELVRHTQNQFDVTIQFAGTMVTVAELVAIRKCVPQYCDMPPSKLRQLVGDSHDFHLGTYSALEYLEFQRNAQRVGLGVLATDTSYTTFLPIDRTTNHMWLIEDDHEARRIAREMIDAGIPVVEDAAD